MMSRRSWYLAVGLLFTTGVLLSAARVRGGGIAEPGRDADMDPPRRASTATVLAAGDIASCFSSGDERTAALLDRLPGTILALGDIAYDERGIRDALWRCNAWGRHKSRIRPVPGNHEYEHENAANYFRYFGAAAGERGRGYYSFDLGEWHLIALNSNVDMSAGSPQMRWLRDDLARSRRACTLAYFHHPYFSSGPHGRSYHTRPAWDILYAAGADVILSAHDHLYERFAPQRPDGRRDEDGGIRQFVVGTGGAGLYRFGRTSRNSEARVRRWGVLELRLEPGTYRWRFVADDGNVYDAWHGRCH